LDGNDEKLWSHQIREVITAKGKTRANTHILNDVSDYQANGKEDEDAARPIEHRSMNQGKDDRRKNMERNHRD
jgi:hypothetical protein